MAVHTSDLPMLVEAIEEGGGHRLPPHTQRLISLNTCEDLCRKQQVGNLVRLCRVWGESADVPSWDVHLPLMTICHWAGDDCEDHIGVDQSEAWDTQARGLFNEGSWQCCSGMRSMTS